MRRVTILSLILLFFGTTVAHGLQRPPAGDPELPLPACTGDPPVVKNADSTIHTFKLTCLGKAEQRVIRAKEELVMKKKAGCSVRFNGKLIRLASNQICTIQEGAIDCEY